MTREERDRGLDIISEFMLTDKIKNKVLKPLFRSVFEIIVSDEEMDMILEEMNKAESPEELKDFIGEIADHICDNLDLGNVNTVLSIMKDGYNATEKHIQRYEEREFD